MVCECGKEMRPLISRFKPESSEWHCDKCRKSKAMSIEHAEHFIKQGKGGFNAGSTR
jgi:hypothetical protein